MQCLSDLVTLLVVVYLYFIAPIPVYLKVHIALWMDSFMSISSTKRLGQQTF